MYDLHGHVSPGARADLADLFDYLAKERGDPFARTYIQKLIAHCNSFDLFPQRGTLLSEIMPGLRLVGYKHKASIAFRIDGDTVVILRILHRGRSLGEDGDAEEDDL